MLIRIPEVEFTDSDGIRNLDLVLKETLYGWHN